MENDLDDICDALETMIDTADDIWEAEQNCLASLKEKLITESYVPAKERFRAALNRYIDNRIREYHNRRNNIYHDNIISGEVDL